MRILLSKMTFDKREPKSSAGYFFPMLILFFSLFIQFSASAKNTSIYGATTALTIVDNLRLRALPEPEGKVLTSIPEGTQVLLLGEKSAVKSTYTLRKVTHQKYWFKVRYNDVVGWVFGGGISLDNLFLYDIVALKSLPFPIYKYTDSVIAGSEGFQGPTIEKYLIQYLDDQLEIYSKKPAQVPDYKGVVTIYSVPLSEQKVIKDCGEWPMAAVCKFSFPGLTIKEVYSLVRRLCPVCLNGSRGLQDGKESQVRPSYDKDGFVIRVKVNIEIAFDEQGNLNNIINTWNNGKKVFHIGIEEGTPFIINYADLF